VKRLRGFVTGIAVVALAGLSGACGDDDDSGGDSTPASGQTATVTSTTAASGLMPDACQLIESGEAGSAMGAAGPSEGTAPQPPSDIASRCEWKDGDHSLSLLVRRGSNAQSSFENAAGALPTVTVEGAEARVQLGVPEASRNYRLATLHAYDETYYLHIVLQGPNRTDDEAKTILTALATSAFDRLP
jgi:hypothetical protein